MTREEMIKTVKSKMCKDCGIYLGGGKCSDKCNVIEIIKALEQNPCEDAISRQAVLDGLASIANVRARSDAQKLLMGRVMIFVEHLSSIKPQESKTRYCKDCKYFEYDSVAKVDGIPLIVAHEICSKWGEGCKTKEDGYCFLFEKKESGE